MDVFGVGLGSVTTKSMSLGMVLGEITPEEAIVYTDSSEGAIIDKDAFEGDLVHKDTSERALIDKDASIISWKWYWLF